MDGLRAAAARDFQNGVAAQVAVGRPRPADRPGLVRLAHVLCVGVGFRIHRNGADAEATAGADHAAGDFAAVGDEDLVEHAGRDFRVGSVGKRGEDQAGAWQTASTLLPSGSITNAA